MKNPRSDPHTVISKVIRATSDIITENGIGSATVRAICKRAGVLPPQIYRQLGNIAEVLDIVVIYQWQMHILTQSEANSSVSNLHNAIDTLIAFGLENSGLYLHASTPRDGVVSELWGVQQVYLMERVRAVALTGRLRVSEEQAVDLIQPFCTGMIFTCLHETSRFSDVSWLSLQVLRPLLRGEEPDTNANQNAPAFASGLKANLVGVSVLSPGEQALLRELLQRIASS